MNLEKIQKGDKVRCRKLGRIFTATIVSKQPHSVEIEPPKGISYRHLKAREVLYKVDE